MLLGAVGLVAIPLVLGITEWNQRNTMIAFYEIEPKVVAGALTASDLPRTANKIVHVAGPVYPQDGAADEYFSLGDQSFLRLRRRTEYCQVCHLGSFTHSTQSGLRCYPCASKWEQTSFTITTEDSAGNRVSTTTYSYHLGWHRHPIASLLFDQPSLLGPPKRRKIALEEEGDVTGCGCSAGSP